MTRLSQLALLMYPYDAVVPFGTERRHLKAAAAAPGSALVWLPSSPKCPATAELVENRPGGLALIVVLENIAAIEADPDLVAGIHRSLPRVILPCTGKPPVRDLSEALRCPPADLAGAVSDFLTWRGLRPDRDTVSLIRQLIDLSSDYPTVTGVSRAMYLSRRALGRRLATRGLPAPSHWLQLGRVLRLAIRLQTREESLFESACHLGYPDAFSASNQMQRVIGHRPSVARERLGLDWVLEAWLRRQAELGNLSGRALRSTASGRSERQRPDPARSSRTAN